MVIAIPAVRNFFPKSASPVISFGRFSPTAVWRSLTFKTHKYLDRHAAKLIVTRFLFLPAYRKYLYSFVRNVNIENIRSKTVNRLDTILIFTKMFKQVCAAAVRPCVDISTEFPLKDRSRGYIIGVAYVIGVGNAEHYSFWPCGYRTRLRTNVDQNRRARLRRTIINSARC